MTDRRNFQRVPFNTKAEISCNRNRYHGELLNISLQGALVNGKGDIPLETGTRCELSIKLLDPEITLQFDAEIIYRHENKFGFMFISEDIATASHLRRLLELNIGSSDAVDQEVAFWLKE